MSYRRLFVFVEGDWDERFLHRILEPALWQEYDDVKYLKYRQESKGWVERLLRSVAAMKADYLFVGDLDRPERCITAAKELLCKTYARLDPERIRLVCLEIESWYAAGVRNDHPRYGALSFTRLPDTDGINKESFDSALLAKQASLSDARLALLDSFDLDLAVERNRSLRYFVGKAARRGPSGC